MPNWTEIKREYITGDIGLRPLAEKHGVSFNTLKDHAKRETWGEERRQFRIDMGMPMDVERPTTAVVETHHTTKKKIPKVVDVYTPAPEMRVNMVKLWDASEAVLDRVLLLMDRCKSMYELRAAAAALKDIKEVRMIKAALDEQEQIARIAKLRAEIKEVEQQNAEPVEITFVEMTEGAAQ